MKKSPATPKCPRSALCTLPKKRKSEAKRSSCGHRSDTFIKSTHEPHLSLVFEVIWQTGWEGPTKGWRDGGEAAEGGRVCLILACGQIIFPLGGVGPIQSDLNSPTLEYLRR